MTAFDKAWDVVKDAWYGHRSKHKFHAHNTGQDDYDDGVPFSEGVKAWSHDKELKIAYKAGYESAMRG